MSQEKGSSKSAPKVPRKKTVPGFKKPSDEEVLTAIYSAGSRLNVIESQHQFIGLVRSALTAIDPAYRIGERRLRLLALKSGYVTVETHTREEEKPSKTLKGCPVCGSRMEKLRNKTIYGGKTVLGQRCPRCSYQTGINYRRPVRYIFTRKIKDKAATRQTRDIQAMF